MSLKAKSSRYLDCVELFANVNEVDALGFPIDEMQSLGVYDANVEQIGGSRALYFQNLGYSHPLIIKMYDPMATFSSIVWNGVAAVVKSITPDKTNIDCIVVYADLKTDNP